MCYHGHNNFKDAVLIILIQTRQLSCSDSTTCQDLFVFDKTKRDIDEKYSQKNRLAILLIYKFYIPISTFRVSYKATTLKIL